MTTETVTTDRVITVDAQFTLTLEAGSPALAMFETIIGLGASGPEHVDWAAKQALVETVREALTERYLPRANAGAPDGATFGFEIKSLEEPPR